MDEMLESIPRLWRGSHMPVQMRTFPTGFAALDQVLPGGGWPMGAVVELIAGVAGIGEVRLLLPLVQRLTLTGNHVLLVHPPYMPNGAMLEQAGVNPERLLVIGAGTERDALWSAEQALRNPACGAVLAWPRDSAWSDRPVRRLQVAARDGESILFLYRAAYRPVSRWAALRLELLPEEAGMRISVLRAVGTHERPQVCVTV